MPSIQRPLAGDVLVVDLDPKGKAGPISPGGREARTLIKSGMLRVTLVTLQPGAELAEHAASGPITVQPLSRIRFTAAGREHDLAPGQLLSAGAGIRHRVASDAGATLSSHPGAAAAGTGAGAGASGRRHRRVTASADRPAAVRLARGGQRP